MPIHYEPIPAEDGKLRERSYITLERQGWGWAWCIVLTFFALSLVKDVKILMWADELFTTFTARQPNVYEIVQAIKEGCDGPPPLYAILVHFLIPIVKNEALAARLPSTIGFCAMMLGLFAFCRKRVSTLYALIAPMLACEVCGYYSTEGRSYGAVLGCAAWALVCWQGAAARPKRLVNLLGLGLFLSLMMALHYYSIFFLGPLLLVELVRWVREKEIDFGIVTAAAVACGVLALHYPLIEAGKRATGHFWSPVSLAQIYPFYKTFLIPIVFVCSLGILVLAFFPIAAGQARPRPLEVPRREWIVLVALSLTPALVIVVSLFTTHIFVDRYLSWSAVGMAALASFAIFRGSRGHRPAGVVMLAILSMVVAGHERIGQLSKDPLLRERQDILDRLKTVASGGQPILVTDAHAFIEMSYYAPAEIRNRIVYPLRRALDLRYTNADSDALLFGALAKRSNLHIEDYEKFMAEYESGFLIASKYNDYLPVYLMLSGWRVDPLPPGKVPIVWRVGPR